MPLSFHAGQREVQDEANTRPVADLLGSRAKDPSEPPSALVMQADLFVLATSDAGRRLRFQAISGQPPLVAGASTARLRLPLAATGTHDTVPVGAIAIDLAARSRARLNGCLVTTAGGVFLQADEAFANCRKYVSPSTALEAALHVGPLLREPIALDDPRLAATNENVETAFIASISVAGRPDVSHRGGPAGFIHLDASAARVSWDELIGNGMFKTDGNIRATGAASLLLLDVTTGDAYELAGRARYTTVLRYDQPRERGLWPHTEHFPVQGHVVLDVDDCQRLVSLINPRRKIDGADKVTSCSPAEDQVPR